MRHLEMQMHHAVEQRRGHRLYDGAVLGAIARTDDYRAFGQGVFTHTALVDKAVERLLYFVRAGVEFVQEETVRFAARDHPGWAEAAHPVKDLWHANQVFRR